MFASGWDKQLPKFVSWKPQPTAWGLNAFSIDWNSHRAYLFPPFSLVGRCLKKIRDEKADVILVAPVWPCECPCESILVSGPIEPSLRRGKNFTVSEIHFDRSKGRASSISGKQQPGPLRLEVVWNRLKHRGVSAKVWNIIRNGSRKTTDKVYQSAW